MLLICAATKLYNVNIICMCGLAAVVCRDKGGGGSGRMTYMVWLLFSTRLMSPGCSSGIHLSSSSIQGYFRDEGTTTRRGHSCLKAYATAMACTVFPRPIWTNKINTKGTGRKTSQSRTNSAVNCI